MNPFKYLLVVAVLACAPLCAQADPEQDLITTLQSGAGAAEKCAACQQLRALGTAKAVPALAALLSQERTAHAARYALEGMPCPDAAAALRAALGQTSGPIRAGLIDSLGWRRDTAAVPLLKPLLFDSDALIASAAAVALGRTSGQPAAAALVSARDKASPQARPAVFEGLLLCAEGLLASGDAKGAAKLYNGLVDAKFPERIRVAGWRGLLAAEPRQRAKRLNQALAGQDRLLHAAALGAVRQLTATQDIKDCLKQWAAAPPDAQLALLDAALKLGPEALPTVNRAAQSPDLAVRVAAWLAFGELGSPSAVPALTKAAAAGENSERVAARETLARLHGPGVREALLNHLAGAAAPEQTELLRALGERDDTAAAKVLVQYASKGPEPVRLAALEALRKLAVPDTATPLLNLVVQAPSEAEGEPLRAALYAVCQAGRDRDQTTRSVVEALARFAPAERRLVLPVLAELGTPAALEAAQAASRDADAELVKEAVRVLSRWPNAAPAPRLFELAGASTDPALRVLAVRGCIAVAGQEPDLTNRLALLQQARAAASQPGEKKQALGQMGQIPTPEALESALADLADPDLANEAGLAALTIAEKLAVMDPALAEAAALKVTAQCKTTEVVKRAWALRRRPAGTGPFIQDWLVCGPYTQAGVAGATALFDVAFGPEKTGEAVPWKPLPRGTMANLAEFFPGRDNCVAYLQTQVTVPQDCEAALLLGSDDGVKAWLNGEVVHSNNVDRGAAVDQDMAPIKLKQGKNKLMLKITQGGGGWGAYARIIGNDGKPIKALRAAP